MFYQKAIVMVYKGCWYLSIENKA